MKLTAREVSEPLWMKLKSELERMREALRKANDEYVTPEETIKLRAKIHLINDLLAMEVPETTIPTQPADDA